MVTSERSHKADRTTDKNANDPGIGPDCRPRDVNPGPRFSGRQIHPLNPVSAVMNFEWDTNH